VNRRTHVYQGESASDPDGPDLEPPLVPAGPTRTGANGSGFVALVEPQGGRSTRGCGTPGTGCVRTWGSTNAAIYRFAMRRMAVHETTKNTTETISGTVMSASRPRG
jgi:hypothetical protein